MSDLPYIPCPCGICDEKPGNIHYPPFGHVCARCKHHLNAADRILGYCDAAVMDNNDPRIPEAERIQECL